MKFVLIVVVALVSAAVAAPLTPDTKPVEKSEIHVPISKDSEAGLVKPVALATGVPSVKVSGSGDHHNNEETPSHLAKEDEKLKLSPAANGHSVDKPSASVSDAKEDEKLKLSPAAVGHSVDKPTASVSDSQVRPVRSNVEKPATNTNQKPASNTHSNAPVHSTSSLKDAPLAHAPVQKTPKDAAHPASTSNVPVQKSPVTQKDAPRPVSTSNVNTNRQPQPVRAN